MRIRTQISAFLLFLTGTASLLGARENLFGYAGFVGRMGPGGAAQARGNTGIAAPDAGVGAFWNPGAAVTLRQARVAGAMDYRQLDRYGLSLGVDYPIGVHAMLSYGMLSRGDMDFKVINSEDEDEGSISPVNRTHYIGIGWRLDRSQGIGLTLNWRTWTTGLEDLQDWNSAPSFSLSWYKKLNPRWEIGLVVRDIGMNGDLVAHFDQSLSSDNSVQSSSDFYPRQTAAGVRYNTVLNQKALRLYLDIIAYQLSEEILETDGSHYARQGRMGVEWEMLPGVPLRAGYDAGDISLGIGYPFKIKLGARKKSVLELNYAIVREYGSGFINPLGVGVRWIF